MDRDYYEHPKGYHGRIAIEEAAKRCQKQVPTGTKVTKQVLVPRFGLVVEQINHGTTDYALAAYRAWAGVHNGEKRTLTRPVKALRGVTNYLVPDGDGNRAIEEQALIVEFADGTTLALTGCSWGYGGEGPHGSAAILHDAGFFIDLESALRYVSGCNTNEPWELVKEG